MVISISIFLKWFKIKRNLLKLSVGCFFIGNENCFICEELLFYGILIVFIIEL